MQVQKDSRQMITQDDIRCSTSTSTNQVFTYWSLKACVFGMHIKLGISITKRIKNKYLPHVKQVFSIFKLYKKKKKVEHWYNMEFTD